MTYRIKLLGLDPNGAYARFLLSSILVSRGWTKPAGIARELLKEVGPHIPGTCWQLRDDDSGVKLEGLLHDWYGRAIQYLAANNPWDAIFMHAHIIDFANHWFIDRVEPASLDYPGDDRYEKLLRKAYEVTDRLLGQVMEIMDDDTLFVLVSDHGSTTRSWSDQPFGNPHRAMGEILEKAGLLVYHEKEVDGVRVINWKKTKAVCQRAGYVYVNLKGREPHGIVEPGEEYEKVRTQVINLFYDYTDQASGKKPITLAIRREHGPLLGLYGDRIGDIIYALEPEFEHAHGQELPTAKYGMGSQTSLLVMAGPGIRRNHVVERPTSLTDIVPTVCHLTGFPVPRQAEGGIIYQALEGS